jgi:hypothetical protein
MRVAYGASQLVVLLLMWETRRKVIAKDGLFYSLCVVFCKGGCLLTPMDFNHHRYENRKRKNYVHPSYSRSVSVYFSILFSGLHL